MAKVKGEDRKVKSKHKYLFAQVKKIETSSFVMNPAELRDFLPKGKKFVIKRVYWLKDWKGETKSGQHCHTDNEEELFIVMGGSATIILDDNGEGKKRYKVGQNDTIFVPKFVWHGYDNASKDFLLLALTTTSYDPERKGYCEDYKEFKKLLS